MMSYTMSYPWAIPDLDFHISWATLLCHIFPSHLISTLRADVSRMFLPLSNIERVKHLNSLALELEVLFCDTLLIGVDGTHVE